MSKDETKQAAAPSEHEKLLDRLPPDRAERLREYRKHDLGQALVDSLNRNVLRDDPDASDTR